MIYIDRYLPGMVTGHPRWGDKWKDGGHLLCTNIRELHKFARLLGLKRDWFQDGTFPHYDLTKGMREKAIRAGAYEIGIGQFPDDLLVKNNFGSYERYDYQRKGLIQSAKKIKVE